MSLQKSVDERNANLQSQLDYLKPKLFGSTSEIRKGDIPGQLSIFDSPDEDDKPAVPIEPEIVEVKAYLVNVSQRLPMTRYLKTSRLHRFMLKSFLRMNVSARNAVVL